MKNCVLQCNTYLGQGFSDLTPRFALFLANNNKGE